MRLPMLILFAAAGAGALAPGAEAGKPPAGEPQPRPAQAPTPATVDAATARKAEAAADAYLQQAAVRPDPLAEAALADIEVLLLEAHACLDSKQALKAGERYLAAIEKRKAIGEDQRPLLGKRLRKADHDLVAVSRELLGQPDFDLGDPPAAPAAVPAKDPAPAPAK
jgi:hypothetical protein